MLTPAELTRHRLAMDKLQAAIKPTIDTLQGAFTGTLAAYVTTRVLHTGEAVRHLHLGGLEYEFDSTDGERLRLWVIHQEAATFGIHLFSVIGPKTITRCATQREFRQLASAIRLLVENAKKPPVLAMP